MIEYYIAFKEDVDADGLIRSLGYGDRKSYYTIQGKNNAFVINDSGDNRELIKLIQNNYDCHVKAKAIFRFENFFGKKLWQHELTVPFEFIDAVLGAVNICIKVEDDD
jgi:hypothetical protein